MRKSGVEESAGCLAACRVPLCQPAKGLGKKAARGVVVDEPPEHFDMATPSRFSADASLKTAGILTKVVQGRENAEPLDLTA
jgi:hypothetical protein